MVRVFIKGGVWKNSEDEILKAAVMKYGKQQWARVASLLNRKSAKQCKARWHEWLDPSVKKVEWSRQEEEKLLHLAKLMPAQWKTIGPLVGRTATQCQEHYEKLLDEAAGGESDARQPGGQIDSHPETKPARPDPIDMDEDEMEMLQEARARLANTQGKKAKRKAREKMLNEAKRLADLQKRRELKQAGLLSGAARRQASRRRREIDLGVEIPFHKPAPAGFHDTSQEDRKAESMRQKRLKSVDYQRVNENQYKTREREAVQAQKREEARVRNLERSNMQYVVAQVAKTNDPMSLRKRAVLELPEPRVSTKELGQLAKLQQQQLDNGAAAATTTSGSVTQTLLGDYSDRPLPTPMRTPMSSASKDNNMITHETLMREASQLRRLEEGQTPLLGAVAAPGFQKDNHQNDDLSVATPRLRQQGNQTPVSLAPRDELGLNDDATSVSSFRSIRDMAREERRAAKRAWKELQDALAALPAPRFEYELAPPQSVPDEKDAMLVVETVQDAADVDAAERARRQKEAEKRHEARSSVVKRKDLPRPTGAIPDLDHGTDMAERLIFEEMRTLMKHDAHAFPGGSEKKKGGKKRKEPSLPPETTTTPLEFLPQDYLDAAKELLANETEQVMQATVAKAMMSGEYASEQQVMDAMVEMNTNGSRRQALEGARLKAEFSTLSQATAALRKKNDKLASKIGIKNGGYAKRVGSMQESMLEHFAVLQNHRIELDVFRRLQSQEVRGAEQRLEKLQEELAALEQDESTHQKRYGDLLVEHKRLVARLTD